MTTKDFLIPPLGEDGELLLDGLCADDYVFNVRRGEPWQGGTVYGTGEVSVRAGETVELTVHVRPETAITKVRVTGTLTVPATWIRPPPGSITLSGLDKANAEVEKQICFEYTPYRFETSPIPPGRYLAVVRPCLWSERVTVSDRGGHFDLDVPHPVTLRVAVVDAATGRRAPDASLSCGVPAARTSKSAGPPVETGLFVFQAVPGALELHAEAPGYVSREAPVAAQEDRELSVRLHKAGTVVVRLRLDGRPFEGGGVRMTLEGSNLWTRRRFKAGVARVGELEPGAYDVKLGDVVGCNAVPAQRVKVEAGRTHEVLFDLKRKPVPEEAKR